MLLNAVKSSKMDNFLQRSLQLSEWSVLLKEALEAISEGRRRGKAEEKDRVACGPNSPPVPAHTHVSLLLAPPLDEHCTPQTIGLPS